jgi:hypothetical protein
MLHLNFFTSPRSGVPSPPRCTTVKKSSYTENPAVTVTLLQLHFVPYSLRLYPRIVSRLIFNRGQVLVACFSGMMRKRHDEEVGRLVELGQSGWSLFEGRSGDAGSRTAEVSPCPRSRRGFQIPAFHIAPAHESPAATSLMMGKAVLPVPEIASCSTRM